MLNKRGTLILIDKRKKANEDSKYLLR